MNAFTHIAYNCRDIFAQEKFYTKHFGFKRCRTFNRGKPDEFFLMKLGSMRLEFFTARDLKPEARGGEQTLGYKHLAFEVPDLDAALAALHANGLEHDPIHPIPNVAPGARIAFFRDPEGNIVELMEGYRDEVDV
jgi:glyoxylase I family protein